MKIVGVTRFCPTMRSVSKLLLVMSVTAGCSTPRPPAPATPEASQNGSGGINRADQQSKPYVVMISVDGLRWDFLDKYPTPNFQRLIRTGTRASRLTPAFPTKTFPNHYTLVTGLRPENHGIVANRFYDPVRKASYALSDSTAVSDGSWYGGEPIWVTAEKQGMVSASYFWVGSEAAIKGVRPTMWKRYDGRVPITSRVDSVISWLSLPPERRAHMVTLYMETVDNAAHDHGPDAPEVGIAVLAVDSAIGRLTSAIAALPIRDSTYIVIVSDHGMTSYTPQSAELIASLIDTTDVIIADPGPSLMLHVGGYPMRARLFRDSLNRNLQHGRAFLRSEIPERLRFRKNARIGDVVVMMDEHWQIVRRRPAKAGGQHGWDNKLESMGATFLIAGPGIAGGRTIPAFDNIQVYSLLTELLGLVPSKAIDGRPGWLRSRIMQ